MDYSEMNLKQRAEYLLGKGVIAKLDIDPDTMTPGYSAHVNGFARLPCGYHQSEKSAVEAGTSWLKEKIKSVEPDLV